MPTPNIYVKETPEVVAAVRKFRKTEERIPMFVRLIDECGLASTLGVYHKKRRIRKKRLKAALHVAALDEILAVLRRNAFPGQEAS